MNNFIQLEENDTLKFKIKDSEGNETGEYLEFDLEDIELPLKYQDLLEQDKKNKTWLKNQFVIIEKRQDVKGKKLMSKNEEDKIRAINDFYKKEIEIYNIFLGENGVQKLLNGQKVHLETFRKIDKLIEEQIMPELEKNMKRIENKIKEKYGAINNASKNILK